MFDHGACAGDVRFSTTPFVCLEALSALSTLLDQVLKTTARSSNARLPSAFRISRDQNRGETDGTEIHGEGDRESAQAAPRSTADGFVRSPDSRRRARLARPAEDAREALVGVMTRLILEHARTTATPRMRLGAGHDH
jgi:hypothetical protein